MGSTLEDFQSVREEPSKKGNRGVKPQRATEGASTPVVSLPLPTPEQRTYLDSIASKIGRFDSSVKIGGPRRALRA